MSEARIHRLFLNSPRWSIPIPEGPNSVRVTFSQTGPGTLPVGHMYGVANDRAGYEEQSRTALDHVANLSPFNRGTTALPPFMPTEIGIS